MKILTELRPFPLPEENRSKPKARPPTVSELCVPTLPAQAWAAGRYSSDCGAWVRWVQGWSPPGNHSRKCFAWLSITQSKHLVVSRNNFFDSLEKQTKLPAQIEQPTDLHLSPIIVRLPSTPLIERTENLKIWRLPTALGCCFSFSPDSLLSLFPFSTIIFCLIFPFQVLASIISPTTKYSPHTLGSLYVAVYIPSQKQPRFGSF